MPEGSRSTSTGEVHDVPFHPRTYDASSEATHKVAVEHATEPRSLLDVLSIWSGADHAEPLKLASMPSRPTAMQNVVVAHETAFGDIPVRWAPSTQALPFQTTELSVSLSTATQKVADTH